MPIPEHCQKSLPKITSRTAQAQVQCPVCLSLWIYENGKWNQLPVNERANENSGLVGL